MDDNKQTENINIENNIPRTSLTQLPKMEILQFKNEVLIDIKKSQKLGENKLDKFIELIESKFLKYDETINKLNLNFKALSNDKHEDKINNDHVKNLLDFQTETKDELITINIKLENLEKDLYNNVYRIDKILTESVIYPGIIGNMCKFKTFHDFMDYLLNQTSKNITFRDKSEKDLKDYKNKMDKYLKNFQGQLDSLLKESNIFTKKSVEEAEERIKFLLDEINEKIKSTRVDNFNSMRKFEKNFDNLKEEMNKITEEKLLIIQEENSRIMGNYLENKKEINLIKEQLNYLSNYINEIKSRMEKPSKRGDFKNILNKVDSNKNTEEENKIIKRKNKYESKIKKYIHGEINVEDLGIIKENNIINNDRMVNKYINNNIIEEKRDSISESSNIINHEFNLKSITNYNNIDKYKTISENNSEEKKDIIEEISNSNEISNTLTDTNINIDKKSKISKTKINSNKRELNIKKESYNVLKNKKIPKTTKIIKNSRKDINVNNKENKQITYSNKPKNRNPREINKIRKNFDKIYKKGNKKKKIIKKQENESEENEEEDEEDEEDEEESEEDNEEEEEESFEKTEENLSCDDIEEFSDSDDETYKEEESIENNKYKKKIKRRISKLALPKIKMNKRGSSAKNSKVKKLLNNNNCGVNYKSKEKRIKYINNKSRNNNINNKNIENKKEINEKIDKKTQTTGDNKKLSRFQKDKKNKSNFSKINIKKKLKEKEDINTESNNSNKINSNSKFNKNNNNLLLTQKLNEESTYKRINSKLNDNININIKNINIENSINNNNSEIDIKQLQIKNLNRNIKNYIKNHFKLNDKFNCGLNNLNNNSVSRYLSYDKYPKNDLIKDYNNDINNSSELNKIKNYNNNEYSNIKSRNKIINKNNKDIVNNLNNNMNIVRKMKNNTYLYLPKMFNDFDINSYNNKYMTIRAGNEYYYNKTINLNENINGNKSTIIRRSDVVNSTIFSKMHKNKSATNIYFSDKIKFKNDKISYKNKNYRNNFHKIKPNFSSEIGNNNKTNIGFSSSNNSFNSINQKHNYIINKDYNDYIKNMQIKSNLEKLDNNIKVNEKIISSPIQSYQNYQKERKDNDFKNSRSFNFGKNVLYDNNNGNNYKNLNNNNYPNNIFYLKGKEAQMIQNLVNNLQASIPDYGLNYDNEKK